MAGRLNARAVPRPAESSSETTEICPMSPKRSVTNIHPTGSRVS